MNKQSMATLGIAALAVAVAQLVQSIAMFAMIFAPNIPDIVNPLWIYITIILLAAFSGGVFQGRLTESRRYGLWVGTGGVNALWPMLWQAVTAPETFQTPDIRNVVTFFTGCLVWLAGGITGKMLNDSYPSPRFNRRLLTISAVVIGVLLTLNVTMWVMIHFSEGYRVAKEIALPIPPDCEEIPGDSGDPRTAVFHKFKTTIPPRSDRIYTFYKNFFKEPSFTDVTDKFQDEPAGTWKMMQQPGRDEMAEYQVSAAKWRDSTGKALVSMMLFAEKADAQADWNDGAWKVTGMIYSRPYAEPPPENACAVDGGAPFATSETVAPTRIPACRLGEILTPTPVSREPPGGLQ